jgi:signal peptidase I
MFFMNDDSTSTVIAEPQVEPRVEPRGTAHVPHAGGNGFEEKHRKVERTTQGPPKTIWREYFESAVVTVIMALFGMTFIVQAVKVPTGSMQNTITIGDHLLVNKFIFAPGTPLPFLPQREIKRGDIVVFKYPGNVHNPAGDTKPDNLPFKTNYVKRVIGLPGDTVEVRGDRVYVNNEPLAEHVIMAESRNAKGPLVPIEATPRQANEPYSVYYDPETVQAARAGQKMVASSDFHYAVNDKPYKVPDDSYFVMGDSRDNSSDSRAWGVVPRELVVGRAMFVYWSYDESAPTSGNFLMDFFSNTRWERTGTMIK